jgi:hypothetical protein
MVIKESGQRNLTILFVLNPINEQITKAKGNDNFSVSPPIKVGILKNAIEKIVFVNIAINPVNGTRKRTIVGRINMTHLLKVFNLLKNKIYSPYNIEEMNIGYTTKYKPLNLLC